MWIFEHCETRLMVWWGLNLLNWSSAADIIGIEMYSHNVGYEQNSNNRFTGCHIWQINHTIMDNKPHNQPYQKPHDVVSVEMHRRIMHNAGQ